MVWQTRTTSAPVRRRMRTLNSPILACHRSIRHQTRPTASADRGSTQWIDVFLGQGNQHMLIFSGIAMPAYDSYNDDFNREHIVVMFDQVVSAIVQASATVGLASIHNTDSDFVFATDSVSVFRDDD